jgi:hypothetical protein
MDLMRLMRSLEEFIFEAIALLFFYPKTLLRIIFQPLQAMQYAEQEEAQAKPNPYDDAVSPPLLLLISLLLANGIGLALHVPQAPEASALARTLLDSPQFLLVFRSLLFSVIPLTAAVLVLRRSGQAASRTSLRQPFFAQCYLTSPFALAISLGIIAMEAPRPGLGLVGAITCILAFVWMVGVQTAWFRAKLGIRRRAALAIALALLVWACACVLAVILLVSIF